MADWATFSTLIVVQAERVLVLLNERDELYHLPSLQVETTFHHLYRTQRQINTYFQADMSIVRAVMFRRDEETYQQYVWWLLENHTPDWSAPAGSVWLALADIEADEINIDSYDRQALRSLVEQANTKYRPVFMQLGWYAEIRSWFTQVLTQEGYTLLRPPEQFKQFIYTSLLVAETTDGKFYAKLPNGVFPYFCDEANVTRTLSKLYPDHIPDPVAIHPETGTGIYSDFGITLREQELTTVQLQGVVKTFAQLQIDSTRHIDMLLQSGCIDRRLDMLKNTVDDITANEAPFYELSADEMQRWRNSGELLKTLFDRLASFNLPDALVHGDFHRGNMALHEGKITFFDWSDACISHPFLDIVTIVEFTPEYADVLRDAYLECWLDYAPMAKLREAYEIAFILGAYNQLVSYRSFQDHCEPAYQPVLEWSIPRFTRVILDRLETV